MAQMKPAVQRAQEMDRLIASMEGQIVKVLPRHIPFQRFARLALSRLRPTTRTGELLSAIVQKDPQQLARVLLECASLGLEPDSPLKQSHLVPFKDQIQLIIGYRGFSDLALRSGEVTDIDAEVVYEGDQFDWSKGSERHLKHTFGPQDGQMICVWAMAYLKNGARPFVVLTKRDVMKRKASSRASGEPDSPWQLWEEDMWRKSAIRALLDSGMVPRSQELATAIEIDATAEHREPLRDAEATVKVPDAPPVEPTQPSALDSVLAADAAKAPSVQPVTPPDPAPVATPAARPSDFDTIKLPKGVRDKTLKSISARIHLLAQEGRDPEIKNALHKVGITFEKLSHPDTIDDVTLSRLAAELAE